MSKTLNESQKAAVSHGAGPMLVLAGPGSGKTTVILCRVERLLKEDGIAGKHILVVTFTKAAAAEMKTRFRNYDRDVTFATFHSIFFRILRKAFGYQVEQVIQEDERRKAIYAFVQSQRWEIADMDEYVSKCIAQFSRMHGEMQSIEAFLPDGVPAEEFLLVYQAYEEYKKSVGKLDFEDMMTKCYILLRDNSEECHYWQQRFGYILVDEFQDINCVQYECLRLLARPKNHLFVVGDDDQSIYGFRGARPDFLLQFHHDYPGSRQAMLNINYRSTDEILALAKAVISQNKRRFEKKLDGSQGSGAPVSFCTYEDVSGEVMAVIRQIAERMESGILPEEIAVIYRTNLQSSVFARGLYQQGIPYMLREGGGNIYEHWVTRDLMAYLHLAENETSDSALLRIINKPKRYISKELLSDAKKMPHGVLRGLFSSPILHKWQAEYLENLRADMKQIQKRKLYEALRYIRRVIGYDEYIQEYASFRRTNAEVLIQIADEITELAKQVDDVPQLERLLAVLSEEMQRNTRRTQEQRPKGVLLTTMHGAKGLEFDTVFLPSLMEGIIPHKKAAEASEIEEERRLFYVGMTRAKRCLILSASKSRYGADSQISQFLDGVLTFERQEDENLKKD